MKAMVKITVVMVGILFLAPLAAHALTQTADFNETGALTYKVYNPHKSKTEHLGVYLGNQMVSFDTLMPEDEFLAFCVDPVQWSAHSSEVDLVNPSDVAGGLEAAWLFDNFYKEDNLTIGALQLAIWEAVWDPNDAHEYDLSSGRFRESSYHLTNSFYVNNNSSHGFSGSEIRPLADAFLASLATDFNAGDLDMRYAVSQSPEHQDFIVQMPNPNATPEPATMVLLGLGLIGMAGISRKKSQQ